MSSLSLRRASSAATLGSLALGNNAENCAILHRAPWTLHSLLFCPFFGPWTILSTKLLPHDNNACCWSDSNVFSRVLFMSTILWWRLRDSDGVKFTQPLIAHVYMGSMRRRVTWSERVRTWCDFCFNNCLCGTGNESCRERGKESNKRKLFFLFSAPLIARSLMDSGLTKAIYFTWNISCDQKKFLSKLMWSFCL